MQLLKVCVHICYNWCSRRKKYIVFYSLLIIITINIINLMLNMYLSNISQVEHAQILFYVKGFQTFSIYFAESEKSQEHQEHQEHVR